MTTSLTVGIVQRGPAYYDRIRTKEIASNVFAQAAEEEVEMLVFGEGWFSGYPVWLDYYSRIAEWDSALTKKVYRQMYESSIQVPGEDLEWFCQQARKNNCIVVLGCNERAGDTLYNSVLTIGADGSIANHHRKLMPTYTEKMVHGLGDGMGLKSVATPYGKVTASICWEHWMPLTRQSLHQSGEDIHVALWPKVHELHQVASRHYAFEGRCWVIAVGQQVGKGDMPELLSGQSGVLPEWLLNGGSAIIDPRGRYLLEPQYDTDELIVCTIPDVHSRREEIMTLDVAGHYARPDVFHFSVNRQREGGD